MMDNELRSIEEIKARIEKPQSILGFDAEVLVDFLSYKDAKKHLKPGVTAAKWNKIKIALTREGIINQIKEYMTFAIGKAEDHRGLSAGRSIEKMQAWCWLLKEEDKIDWDNYENYGAPILKQICDTYELKFDFSESFLNMAEGKPCEPGCDMGCGH